MGGPRLSLDSKAQRQFTPCAYVNREPTAAEQDEFDALARWGAELEQQAQALDDAPEWSPDEAELIDFEEQDIEARRKAIHGLVREADRKAMAAAARPTSKADDRAPGRDDNEDQGLSSPSGAPERRTPGCSEALTKRLAAHWTMAIQAMPSQNSAVALASVVHVFVLRTFGADHPHEASALQVSLQMSAHALEAVADDLKTNRAWQAVHQAKEAWRAQLPEQQGEWLAWLMGRTPTELINLLALCSALTVNVLPGAGASTSANAIAAAVGLDMADWWEPTAEGYLNHVPKAQIVEALKEVETDLAGGGIEALK